MALTGFGRQDVVKIIDLTLPIDDKAFEPFPVRIKRLNHSKGADHLGRRVAVSKRKGIWENIKGIFNYISGSAMITHKTFPDQEFLALERVDAIVHTGTHLDAPYHFGSKSEGKKAKMVEEIPLEWCYGNGVVLDFSYKNSRELITEQDIKEALQKIAYELRPLDIVLIHTGADKHWPGERYFRDFPGMSKDALASILKKGVKVVGIDAYSLDRPFNLMFRDFFKTNDNRHLWPAHLYGREREYCHIERLANLDKIPRPYGFRVACFPIKIREVSASWVRAVAIIE